MAKGYQLKDRTLLAVIGDEDTVTGLLLAGIGNVDNLQRKNFFIVDNKTPVPLVESTFQEFIQRKDIAIILINQHVAELIRSQVDQYTETFPTILEIPSKDHPYDPNKGNVSFSNFAIVMSENAFFFYFITSFSFVV
ncbi:H(+)-transporting V1 sector ATPase subunit F [Coelomomyces lativittatus]|nr:H(+)-transporting V1 sector ATPase subunit F [Coelomomyces lativittatus]